MVLCELEGFGHDEAARQLGCAVGTVKSRLSRAREKLRSRLIRRGIAPTAWALAVESASAAVPAKLIETTVKAAIGHADGVISPAVTLLIQGVLRAMLLKKLSAIGVAVVARLALATMRGCWRGRQLLAGGEETRRAVRSLAGASACKVSRATLLASRDRLGPATPKEAEEDTADRIELLRLDVELLAAEVQALKGMIVNTSANLNATHVPGQRDGEQTEKLRPVLDTAHKEYIAKQKEFHRKRAELSRDGIETTARRQQSIRLGKGRRSSQCRHEDCCPRSIRGLSESGDFARSRKRLSGIEQKLEEVLKALTALRARNSPLNWGAISISNPGERTWTPRGCYQRPYPRRIGL